MSRETSDCPFEIGNTPLTSLTLAVGGLTHEICLKEERFNAFGSIKDRVAWYILSKTLSGREKPAGVVDASSGNYGFALASIGKALGLPVTIVTSASISGFNADGIRQAGAQLILAEAQPGESSNAARMRVAGEIAERESLLFLDQYSNALNPLCHQNWTAPELLRDGPFDACFVAASSGGTARGFIDCLSATNSRTKLVLVEPGASQAFVAAETAHGAKLTIPGYGSGRKSSFAGNMAPPALVRISNEQVLSSAVYLAENAFPAIGLSSIGVLLGAIKWLETATSPMRVACVCADGAERYSGEMETRYLPGADTDTLQSASARLASTLEGLGYKPAP